MIITTLGWLWIGVIIGATAGVVWSSIHYTKQIGDLEEQIVTLRGTRNVLKDELVRLNNSAKPKPRSRRKGYKK